MSPPYSARILAFPTERHWKIVAGRTIPAERRSRSRYPLDLVVRFRAHGEGSPFSATGVVINMSSGGILVASERPYMAGALVDMSVEWPALLEGRIPLQFFAIGRVLRSETSTFAAAFQRHEFRILRSSTSPAA
jgi:PilZ domain